MSIIVANQQIRIADFDPSFASVKQKGAPMRNAQRKDVLHKEHEVTRAAGRRQVPLQAVQVVDWVYIPTFIFRIYLDKLQYFTHLKSSAIWGLFPLITITVLPVRENRLRSLEFIQIDRDTHIYYIIYIQI